MLTEEPHIIERPAQPYAAIKAQVTMQTLGTVLPGLHPRVFAWLGERGVAPTGAPFWKYNVVDMERGLEVEVGVPGWKATRAGIPSARSVCCSPAASDNCRTVTVTV